MVILRTETPNLPSFKTYAKTLPFLARIEKTDGKRTAQIEMDVLQKLLPPNEDTLAPTQGVVLKSMQLCGYHNPAPFDFSVELKIKLKSFARSSSVGLYGLNPTKSCTRTSNEKGSKTKQKGAKTSSTKSSSMTEENDDFAFKVKLHANTLIDALETSENASAFGWKHPQYKTMGRFANFNFSSLNASSIKGTFHGISKTSPSSTSLIVDNDNAPGDVTTSIVASDAKDATHRDAVSNVNNEDDVEELHWSDSLIHSLVLLHIISDLGGLEQDRKSERLSYYSSLLKYGQDDVYVDTTEELSTQLHQRQQTSHFGHSTTQTPQQASKKWVFINGKLCREIRDKVAEMSESVKYANLCNEGTDCTIFVAKNVELKEDDNFFAIFTLKVEYMYVPFNNVQEAK